MQKNQDKLHTFHFVYFTWKGEIRWVDIQAVNESLAIRQWMVYKMNEDINLRFFMYMTQVD